MNASNKSCGFIMLLLLREDSCLGSLSRWMWAMNASPSSDSSDLRWHQDKWVIPRHRVFLGWPVTSVSEGQSVPESLLPNQLRCTGPWSCPTLHDEPWKVSSSGRQPGTKIRSFGSNQTLALRRESDYDFQYHTISGTAFDKCVRWLRALHPRRHHSKNHSAALQASDRNKCPGTVPRLYSVHGHRLAAAEQPTDNASPLRDPRGEKVRPALDGEGALQQ